MRLAVVVPLANEQPTVAEFLTRLTAQLGPEDAVFCIVDNASKDDTRGAVERFIEACQWPVVSGPLPEDEKSMGVSGYGGVGVGKKEERSEGRGQRAEGRGQRSEGGTEELNPELRTRDSGPTTNPLKASQCGGQATDPPSPRLRRAGNGPSFAKASAGRQRTKNQEPEKPTINHSARSALAINHQPSVATVPVHCVYAPENHCVVDAYFRGYREAYDAGAKWILEMDGGLSHLPEEIPQFIAAMEAGVDFAAGSRFVKEGGFNGRFSRKLISKAGTFLSNLLLGTRMTDMTSGFECFSRQAMKRVLDHGVKSRAHFFQTEIRYLMHQTNWMEVPITYSCPSKSVGKSSLMDALKCLWNLWRNKRNRGKRF